DRNVTGVQTCALPIYRHRSRIGPVEEVSVRGGGRRRVRHLGPSVAQSNENSLPVCFCFANYQVYWARWVNVDRTPKGACAVRRSSSAGWKSLPRTVMTRLPSRGSPKPPV